MHTTACNVARTDLEILETWLTAAREEGLADTYAGKRAHPRMIWVVPATLEILDPDRPAAPAYIYTSDISRGGMGLRCRQPVELFAQVRITLDETGESLCGQVRHCTPIPTGFIVGIEFELQDGETLMLRKSA